MSNNLNLYFVLPLKKFYLCVCLEVDSKRGSSVGGYGVDDSYGSIDRGFTLHLYHLERRGLLSPSHLQAA